ncbi:pro-adrenomedullin [Bombina bombina]|uniref:pro-adrenomedullin n=1 Tax=Bombina bombina TaxID=8345 RepID=UPI00235AC6AB|nr:pro-adrenomedullin [Bombina bombina]
MELAHIILLQLSYLTFLGAVAEKVEFAPGEKKKLSLILNQARRDLNTSYKIKSTAQITDATSGSSFIKEESTKDLFMSQSSNEAHVRVKRYRQSPHLHHFQTVRIGCRFGTCTVQNLAHQIFQYTNKDKDGTAPVNKISPQGYGRRRRSIPEKKLLLPVVDGKMKPSWIRNNGLRSPVKQQLVDFSTTPRPSSYTGTRTKGKMWESLLRT